MNDGKTFLQRVAERQERLAAAAHAGASPPPAAPPGRTIIESGAGGEHDRRRRYAEKALRDECDLVAFATEGTRNDTLNRAAFSVARFVNEDILTADEVTEELTAAARAAGLPDVEIRATLASAARGSLTKARNQPAVPAASVPESRVLEVNGHDIASSSDELTAEEQEDLHSIQVKRRAYELRVNDEARALWTRQRATLAGRERPSLVNLTDLLAQPDEDASYRIADLLPIGGRALLAAQYKAGKTSMIANLLRSLVDGHPFLGRMHVEPVGRVVLIDTELDERMLRRWLRDQNIDHRANVDILSLRGRLSGFDILDDTTRADWAAAMHGADFVILDCLRPCLDALGLSEDKEAGRFLTAFDSLCHEAGATEAVVVHHMGHGQERSRGDSRLLDWPDVLWKIVRDDDEGETADRYFSALGRDVNVPESRLDWTPETRALTLCDGGRTEKRARGMAVDIIEILSDPANVSGLSQNKLIGKLKALGNSREASRRAVQSAIGEGVILTVDGPRNTLLHVLNPSRHA
ncbi:AAA family ATPase [Mycolicibacterium sp. F2034L]|uniref:AAA family ATPase n=1 Tax=Mycolicibacterium sp. F2034L TaxID=2926422 RepID=UPI001FF660D1|nr:AAA family ATPase [Mycolicibacterium sp. F2034L]MCK0174787.1 AAA family ATPase [Mycolicibacterium sp. F2034L]